MPTIDYTAKDYETIRAAMLARIPKLTDRWTDFNPSDLGMVLLELFAGVGDLLARQLETQAGEAFLGSVQQRQNLINLCKLIGYRPDRAVAATTELRFVVERSLSGDLVLPEGMRSRATIGQEEIPFTTTTSAVIYRGQTAVTIPARQGLVLVESFQGTGTPFQFLTLQNRQIAEDGITVRIDGIAWTPVDHFQESGPEDPHFLIETDASEVVYIVFGDGLRGTVPTEQAAIEVTGLQTLGASGNLAPHRVTEVVSPVYFENELVRLQVTNPVPATGGSNREAENHARMQAPAELRTLWRAVTKSDFLALATGFPGVAKAQILDTEDCCGTPIYQVNLVVAPHGGGPPSALLLQDLAEFLETRKIITTEIRLFEPDYRPIAIDAEVFAFADQDPDAVRARIETGLQAFFAFDAVTFAQNIYFSDVVALLDGIRGVSHVHLYTPSEDILLRPGQIPILGQTQIDVRSAVS